MKLFAASENKLKRVMAVAKNGMESTGLKWNEKKRAVVHVKRGQVEQGSGDMMIADLKLLQGDTAFLYLLEVQLSRNAVVILDTAATKFFFA